MISTRTLVTIGVAAVLAAGCTRRDNGGADAGVGKTGFPGMLTAGGGTSGEVIARAQKPATDASYAGGTPYHAGGAGGTTGGTATGGTVQETGHGPSGKNTPPAPAQTQAQAARKAAADAQAEKDQQLLLARMDAVSAKWRATAGAKGLKVNPQTPLASPVAAVTAPANQAAPSGQPDGKLTAAAAAPIKSEKSNTAAPSADIKRSQSPPASSVKTK